MKNTAIIDGVAISQEALGTICDNMEVSLTRAHGLPYGVMLQEGNAVARAINGLRQQNDTLFVDLMGDDEEGLYKQRIREAMLAAGAVPHADVFVTAG